MSQHFDNETLKEQRKARNEFLELKKMESGELNPGPKPSEIAIVPNTFGEKVKNFWYHNKNVLICSVIGVIIIAVLIAQCSMKPKYDLQIVFYTYTPVLEENVKNMETYFEKYCSDVNDDGKIKVNVINCSYDNKVGGPQFNNTYETRLQATVASEANALLYITDERSYKHFTDVFGADFFEGSAIPMTDDFYKSCTVKNYINLPGNLTISLRKVSGTMVEKDKNAVKYQKASKSVISKIFE